MRIIMIRQKSRYANVLNQQKVFRCGSNWYSEEAFGKILAFFLSINSLWNHFQLITRGFHALFCSFFLSNANSLRHWMFSMRTWLALLILLKVIKISMTLYSSFHSIFILWTCKYFYKFSTCILFLFVVDWHEEKK